MWILCSAAFFECWDWISRMLQMNELNLLAEAFPQWLMWIIVISRMLTMKFSMQVTVWILLLVDRAECAVDDNSLGLLCAIDDNSLNVQYTPVGWIGAEFTEYADAAADICCCWWPDSIYHLLASGFCWGVARQMQRFPREPAKYGNMHLNSILRRINIIRWLMQRYGHTVIWSNLQA